MTSKQDQTGGLPAISPAAKPGGWGVSLLLGLALTGIYLANRADSLGTTDTAPAELIPTAIVRGDGPYIDRFMYILTAGGRGSPASIPTARRSRPSTARPGRDP